MLFVDIYLCEKERKIESFFLGVLGVRDLIRSFGLFCMESNSMSGGIYSSSRLGLEMSLHHNLPPQNPHHISQHHHPIAAAFAPHDHLQQQSAKQAYPKAKNHSLTLSDDDEPGFTAENNSAGDDGKRKMSPWQRMKWTDDMVRLLIMVVFYIGDEVGSEGSDPASKKKGSGVLQKKGKWKSVSRAMMERGFYVSPQQCEDKFNDLNKRYKRVNDILGKGTSCRVVENQALLDAMDLSPKLKDEVKKLLNSKHLFFREMCAYHNSCGHASGGVQHSPPSSEANAATEVLTPLPQAQQTQRCLHSTEKGPVMPNLNRGDHEGPRLAKGDDDDEDEEDDDDDGDGDGDGDDEEEDDDEVMMGGSGSRFHERGQGDDKDNDERSSTKRTRKGTVNSALIQQLDAEIMNILRDGGKTQSEKRHWLKTKEMVLEEQRVGILSQSFELEKQRLKWLKFSTKKEREMEREKLMNERTKLENERMVLLIRQKELDLIDHHHHQQQQQHSSNKKSDPSSITG